MAQTSKEVNDHSYLAVLYAKTGKAEDARRQIKAINRAASNVAQLSDLHHVQYNLGAAHALLGDVRDAVTWLKKASREGFPCYPSFERDPNLASLRDDAEFAAFMEQLRSQWERFRQTL